MNWLGRRGVWVVLLLRHVTSVGQVINIVTVFFASIFNRRYVGVLLTNQRDHGNWVCFPVRFPVVFRSHRIASLFARIHMGCVYWRVDFLPDIILRQVPSFMWLALASVCLLIALSSLDIDLPCGWLFLCVLIAVNVCNDGCRSNLHALMSERLSWKSPISIGRPAADMDHLRVAQSTASEAHWKSIGVIRYIDLVTDRWESYCSVFVYRIVVSLHPFLQSIHGSIRSMYLVHRSLAMPTSSLNLLILWWSA